MGLTVTTRGRLPRKVWDLAAARRLGMDSHAIVDRRAFDLGLDLSDSPFDPYSTTPIAFDFRHPFAVRVGKAGLQRGGEPMYGLPDAAVVGNPMRAFRWSYGPEDVARSRSDARRTRKLSVAKRRGRKDWKVIGRRFPGGYAQLKSGWSGGRGATNPSGVAKLPTSPSPGGQARVNLQLTGAMRQDFRVKGTTSAERVVIGLTRTADYGTFVNARRPWIGVSPRDREQIQAAFERLVREVMDASAGDGGSAGTTVPAGGMRR